MVQGAKVAKWRWSNVFSCCVKEIDYAMCRVGALQRGLRCLACLKCVKKKKEYMKVYNMVLSLAGLGLKCFVCNSHTDSACSDMLQKDSPALQEAFVEECQVLNDTMPFCRKVKESSEYRRHYLPPLSEGSRFISRLQVEGFSCSFSSTSLDAAKNLRLVISSDIPVRFAFRVMSRV